MRMFSCRSEREPWKKELRKQIFIKALSVTSGLYGHSAVYHEESDAIYVFGGFEYLTDKSVPSSNLYSLLIDPPLWSLLSPEVDNRVSNRLHWCSSFLAKLFLWCVALLQNL